MELSLIFYFKFIMIIHYFVPFIFNNSKSLFYISSGYTSVTAPNRTHTDVNIFDHKDAGNHLLQ
jgi:hypothetical protein